MEILPRQICDHQTIECSELSNVSTYPAFITPSDDMNRMVMPTYPCQIAEIVSDDDMSIATNSAFSASLYHGDADDENHDDGYDDYSFSDLIFKLRGGTAAGHDHGNVCIDGHGEDDLTDDMIAKHLKALTSTTKIGAAKYDDASVAGSTSFTDDLSLMTYETGAMDGDTSDEESDDEDLYAGVDVIMKKLVSASGGHTDDTHTMGCKWLEQMSQQGACDYVNAPQTVSSKKQWLVNLATELMEEVKGQEKSVEMDSCSAYELNVLELAKESERAEELMANPTVEQQADVRKRKPASKPKRLRKAATPACFPSVAEILKRQATAGPKVTSTPDPWAAKTLANPFTLRLQLKQDVLVKVPNSANVVIRPQRDATTIGVEKAPQASIKAIPAVVPASDSSTTSTEAATNIDQAIDPVESPRSRNPPRNSGRQKKRQSAGIGAIMTATIIERSQHLRIDTNAGPGIVIPPGFPPYPGHGPKWPWHPSSPQAPNGYKECYMHHMGEYYRQYMEYLQTRAASSSTAEKQSEDILRSSLSVEAKFKKSSERIKSSEKGVKKTSKRPALSPTIFASKPGKARQNCVVPVILPKIDEGSNSSSGSSADERRRLQTKMKPEVLTVGKIHKKSLGKKGRIVVVTGRELDQKAKEERKKLSQRKSKGATALEQPKPTIAAPIRSKSVASLDAPNSAAIDQRCACCIVM